MSIESIKEEFANLKKNGKKTTKKTKRELIAELSDDIRDLRSAGYSFEDILNVIKKNGETITESTLKKYLTEATNAKKNLNVTETGKKKRTSKKATANSSAKASSKAVAKPSHTRSLPLSQKAVETEKGKRAGAFDVLSDDA
jgi:hypothetical protein